MENETTEPITSESILHRPALITCPIHGNVGAFRVNFEDSNGNVIESTPVCPRCMYEMTLEGVLRHQGLA